ncbi:hypothetical protein WR25_12048 [Diploscapter pachys]|uniref:Uncharacterized protein n=1 Tax=Diploscapter pachys TaxID=2018661 RepID=A0A2A2LMF5_9BILA|nr:hypothetical protein WR25_12048 [Diploscapter pachys]
MRALGLDPDDPTKVDHDKVRVNLQYNNAKKAEAARLRYHRMSLDEKRAYNQRRTEAFRRRRQEEESLLSTPAGRISNEALSKAQQIMVRNAKKAEAARLRYQRMSPEQRKEYNAKRAHAKKIRAAMARGETPGMLSSNGSIASGDLSESFPSASNSMIIDSIVDPSPSGVRTVARQRALNARHMQSNLSNSSILDEHPDDEDFDEEIDSIRRELQMGEERANDGEMMSSINKGDRDQEDDEHFIDVAGGVEEDMQHEGGVELQTRREPVDEQDEILNRLEREVIRRTKMAQMALLRQRTERTHGNPRNTAPPTERCEKMMLTSDGEIVPMPMAEQEVFMQPVQQQYIDEKALMSMLVTGIDSTGCPIEIRLPDGTLITTEAMLKESMR